MVKDKNYFIEVIERQRKKFERFTPSNISYGSNVLPLLNLYNELSYDEKSCYLDAIKCLLLDKEKNKQDFAVDICVGFIVFKEEIK